MQQNTLNTISDNIANIRTQGYKTSRLLSSTFEQTLLSRLEKGKYTGIGTGEPVRIVSEVVNFLESGGLTETNRPFDMAISGEGFFNVQAEDGVTYLTRDGQFDLDENNYLVLRGKGRVMGTNGPIQLAGSDFKVDSNGAITNSQTGAAMGQLRITVPNQDAVIKKARVSMYQVVEGGVANAQNPLLVQGALENSNVNMTDEMTAMIAAQRNFASAAQALQYIDATYTKAISSIASV